MTQSLLRITAAAMAFAMAACSTEPEQQAQADTAERNARPNVIIFLADDAGYADFGFAGSKDLKTPRLDQLAQDGVYFTDAHTSASVCSPSRAGILTGRYQQRFGHENNVIPSDDGMDVNEVTLADELKNQGYKTAIFGKWHLGSTDELHPNERGFDEFYGFLNGSRPYFASKRADEPGRSSALQHNGKHQTFDGYLTDVLGQKAEQFIVDNKDQPFFIYLSYNAVHTPMQATKEDLALFEGHPRQALAAMTWAMDRSIGGVIDTLKEQGLYDNTMMFFFSDNGGPTGSNSSSNYPLKASKGYEFEGGHRVPFVFTYGDKLPKGSQYHQLTSMLDIFPTVLSEAGIETNTGKPLDGVNLMPYLKGEVASAPHTDLFWRIGPWGAMRSGDMKLINAKGVDTALYRLDSDISESKDLKAVEPATHQQLMSKFKAWEDTLAEPRWPGANNWLEFKTYRYKDYIDHVPARYPTMGAVQKAKKNGEIE